MVPKSRPMSQCASAQPAADLEDLVGPGVAREVEVGRDPPEEGVAHRAPDERQLVAGRREELAELVSIGSAGCQPRHGRLEQEVGESGIGHHRVGEPTRQPARSGAAVTPRRHPVPSGRVTRAAPRGMRGRVAGCHARAATRRAATATPGYGGEVSAQPLPTPVPGRRLPAVEERSAGGIVVDVKDGCALIAIIARRNRAGRIEWCLPKGHVEPGETLVETAAREVAEETGIVGRVLVELGTIDYWFATSNKRVHKFVHHYLLEALGGELSDRERPRPRGHRRRVDAARRGAPPADLPQRTSHRAGGVEPAGRHGVIRSRSRRPGTSGRRRESACRGRVRSSLLRTLLVLAVAPSTTAAAGRSGRCAGGCGARPGARRPAVTPDRDPGPRHPDAGRSRGRDASHRRHDHRHRHRPAHRTAQHADRAGAPRPHETSRRAPTSTPGPPAARRPPAPPWLEAALADGRRRHRAPLLRRRPRRRAAHARRPSPRCRSRSRSCRRVPRPRSA